MKGLEKEIEKIISKNKAEIKTVEEKFKKEKNEMREEIAKEFEFKYRDMRLRIENDFNKDIEREYQMKEEKYKE